MTSRLPLTRRRWRRLLMPVFVIFCMTAGSAVYFASTRTALALSEIQSDDSAATPAAPEPSQPGPEQVAPDAPAGGSPAEQSPGDAAPNASPTPEGAGTGSEPEVPSPQIEFDLTKLPEPVQRTRNAMLEAAKSGDIEKLRPLLGTGSEETQLSLGGIDGDPIAFLKEASGDDEGHEILAIMEEVLSTGYVHMEPGTPNELYVWPYFFALPIDKLTPAQRVELFKIVTAGDYEDMKSYGGYIFYRVGIAPDGKWSFFLAGD